MTPVDTGQIVSVFKWSFWLDLRERQNPLTSGSRGFHCPSPSQIRRQICKLRSVPCFPKYRPPINFTFLISEPMFANETWKRRELWRHFFSARYEILMWHVYTEINNLNVHVLNSFCPTFLKWSAFSYILPQTCGPINHHSR